MKRIVLFVPLIIAIGLGVFLAFGLGNDPSKLESARIDDPLPAFQLGTLKGADQLMTNADLPKQPFLLNVWATWCPSCKVEHPYLLKIAQEFKVPIVGLNYKDDLAAANVWLEKYEDPYLLNIYDPKGKLGFDLGVYGAPETYVIDGQGVVRYRHVGVVDQQVWREKLAPLINGG